MDKKKILSYSLSIVLPSVILALVLKFAVKLEAAYVTAYTILCMEVSYQIVGVVWHTVKNDWSVKLIASKVWFTALIASTASIIISDSWTMAGMMVGFGLIGIVNWAGFRFVVKDDSGFIPAIKEAKVKKLSEKMLYRNGEDGKPNQEEPLCIVEGVPVTPARAMEKGYVAEAEKAIAYIRSII